MECVLIERPTMTYTLVPEPEGRDAEIERLLDRAFGPGRFAKTGERVRERGARLERRLSRVILRGDEIVGVCRLWRIAIGGADALFLGPLAIAPEHQEQGLAMQLIHEAARACQSEADAVIVVGTPRRFNKAGFVQVPAGRVALPGPADPARFMWLETRAGGLDRVSGAISAPRDASPA